MSRVKGYYERPRSRVNAEVYLDADSTHVKPHSQMFDKKLERVLLPMSFRYDLLRNRYDIELIEYRRATAEEFMKWIFWDGDWDDDGFWMDDEDNYWL